MTPLRVSSRYCTPLAAHSNASMTQSSSGLQPTLVAIDILMPCLAFIFVVIRLYSRLLVIKVVNFEDTLIIVAMVCRNHPGSGAESHCSSVGTI